MRTPEKSWNYFSPSSFKLALGSEPMWSGLCSKYLSLSHRANNGVAVVLVLCHIAPGPLFHWPKDSTKPLICWASFYLKRSNDQNWILVFLLVQRSLMGPSVRNQVNIIPMSNIPCESSWISTSGTLLQRHPSLPSLPCINLPPSTLLFFPCQHSQKNAIATHSSPSYKRKKKISPSHIFWILFSLRNSMNKFTSSVIRFSFASGARYSLIQSF